MKTPGRMLFPGRRLGLSAMAGAAAAMAAMLLLSPAHLGMPGTEVGAQSSCTLTIDKDDNPATVAEDGQITYTITVENSGDNDCANVDVTDKLSADLACDSARVVDTPDGVAVNVGGCGDDNVTWNMSSSSVLAGGESMTLEVVVSLANSVGDGDTVANTACVTARGEQRLCDSESTQIGAASSTPSSADPADPPRAPGVTIGDITIGDITTTVTTIVTTNVTTITAPATGSGPESAGAPRPAIALGIAGAALLLASGASYAVGRRSQHSRRGT